MKKQTINPEEWNEFLANFSNRNRGRRSRFEAFSRDGVREEDEEAAFEAVSIAGDLVTVNRTILADDKNESISDPVEGIHGIAVQLDSDGSENTMEFMDMNGDMTVLHFESMVDGDS